MAEYQSLHTHTSDSDGQASHLDVLAAAEENNFGVVAFTDHDVLLSKERLEQLRGYKGPIKWISGVELSAGLPVELGGGTTGSLHIVGLFVDPGNDALAEHCHKTLKARERRMRTIVSNLQHAGFRVKEEDCLEASGGESVGRPHIAQAIEKYQENQQVYAQLEARAKVEHPEWYATYEREVQERPSQRPYRLILADDAYLEGVYVDSNYWQDFDTCVRLIRQAGGVAIWAHWWTVSKKVDRAMLEDIVAAGRIDALEARFPLGLDVIDTQESFLQSVAKKHDLPQITAVDLHDLEAFAELARQPEDAATTANSAQELVERFEPDTRWSNLE